MASPGGREGEREGGREGQKSNKFVYVNNVGTTPHTANVLGRSVGRDTMLSSCMSE